MGKTFFTCFFCKIECDISAVANGYEDMPFKICQVCADSFCPRCDSQYRKNGIGLTCPECGYDVAQTTQDIRNNIERMEKANA